MATQPKCRKCGEACIWLEPEPGKFRIGDPLTGRPHYCKEPEPDVVQPVLKLEQRPRYDEPIERDDASQLARQIARLATAVESLCEEVRELRRDLVPTRRS